MSHPSETDILAYWMPLRFNALVVETTNQCNAKCDMCYQSSGPKGSDKHGKAVLPSESIKRIIKEASRIDTINKRFHFSGGEAFLDLNKCIDLINYAASCDFISITAVTNAFWADTPEKANKICARLRDAGLTALEISWDSWHLPYIQPNSVSNCLDACYEFEIQTTLRVLGSKQATHKEALLHIKQSSLSKASLIYCSQVFPTGRAEELVGPDNCYQVGSLEATCHSSLNLTVNAYGEVYPCCAGFDQTDTYKFGNISDYSLEEIILCMNNSPLLRTLVFYGTLSLKRILEKYGYNIGNNFTSICHLCTSIFNDKDAALILKRHFVELQRDRLLSSLNVIQN